MDTLLREVTLPVSVLPPSLMGVKELLPPYIPLPPGENTEWIPFWKGTIIQ